MSEHSGTMALAELDGVRRAGGTLEVDALYRRYHALVYRLALRYGRGDAAWAEDVTQEVFLRLFDVIDRLEEGDGLEGWFYRVTSNRCLNRLRRERVRNAAPVRWLLGQKARPPVDPERLTAARQGLHKAWSVLDELPPKERVAFCMVHVDGKTLVEIGEVLGHTKGYVCKLVKRAEARVRAQGWEVESA
ncbi:MAG: sigma-70 family RNA polymerase sigma factor [Myxococcales bacterium]|nr:sigma-70 family RNA polymerase sigma factor [Myxococcales bacterium]